MAIQSFSILVEEILVVFGEFPCVFSGIYEVFLVRW